MAKTRKKQTRAQREEDELERSYRNISPARKKSKKRKKSHRTGAIVAISIFLLAIVLFIIAGYFYFLSEDMKGVILENVTVAGVDVGGMTQAEAIIAVHDATKDTYSSTPMVVSVLEHKVEIPTNCVGPLNVRKAVKAAYKFGNSGTAEKRQQEQKTAMTKGYAVDLTPYLNVKEETIRNLLDQLGAYYNTALKQTTYQVVGDAPNQTLVISLGTPEYGLNLNTLYEQVLRAYSNNKFQVKGYCGMINPEPLDLKAVTEKYYKAPVDAHFDSKNRKIVNGIDGYGLDLESAQKKLDSAPYGSTVKIPFVAIPPEMTAEKLEALQFQDTLATYTAKADSNSKRDVNLRLACEAIHNTVLYPKDIFSFNDTLGEPTAKKGYQLVDSNADGTVKKIYGGGISQVSSALYYCTLISELEILCRDNHVFYPGFIPLGMDATVAWNSIDFQFQNNTLYPIRIEAKTEGGTVTVSLIGTETRNYRTELEYEDVAKTEYDVTYQTMQANNPEGYRDGDYIVEPCYGYKIKTYRCKYDKSTGEQLSRDFIEQSNYAARNGVVCRIEGSTSSGLNGGNISDAPGLLP